VFIARGFFYAFLLLCHETQTFRLVKYQNELLDLWKNKLPDPKEAAKVLSETLHISLDSAYRRMRGDTALSFDEGVQLMRWSGLSTGALTGGSKNQIPFFRNGAIDSLEKLEQVYEANAHHINQINNDRGQMYYLAKDVPIFYNFLFPSIARFKTFVWIRSLYNFKDQPKDVFDSNSSYNQLAQVGQQMAMSYQKIPSVEFWTDSTISSMLKQVRYFYEMGAIKSVQVAEELLDDFRRLIDLIILQAELGLKVNPTTLEPIPNASFTLYYHELLVMDNSVLGIGEERKLYFAPYSGLNYLSTTDPSYCDEILKWCKDQMNNSVQISESGNKERVRFHHRMHQQIDTLKEFIRLF